jgi:thiol-disulfide isomerase/thioredoxin
MAALLASAVLNYRHRQAQIAAQPQRMQLAPEAPAAGSAGGASGTMPDGSPDLRGKPAPDFTLKDLNGKPVSLKDFRGKGVLVNFWATWCAPCKVEIPWFIALNQQYGPQGLVVLGLTAEDIPLDEVQKSVKELHIDYPVLQRADTIGKDWGGLDGLPMSFYIDRNGKIVDQTVGLYSRDEVEAKIKKILAAPASAATQSVASVERP